jgi:hypothetical protein
VEATEAAWKHGHLERGQNIRIKAVNECRYYLIAQTFALIFFFIDIIKVKETTRKNMTEGRDLHEDGKQSASSSSSSQTKFDKWIS